MLIEWDVEVPMDDGVVLRGDVFRPEGDGLHPAILTCGPYGKGLAYQDGYPDQWRILVARHPEVLVGSENAFQNWETVDPERFVPDGFACVRVDSRGAGRSPGFLDPWSPRETRDLYEAIEWAAAQPWCNGRVGLCGISYYAMNQWQVAALEPPHLAAICVWEGAADFYRDTTYHGGIRCVNWGNWYELQVTNVQHGVGDRGPVSRFTGETVCGPETLSPEELAASRTAFYADVRAHPLDDDWHRERSPRWDRVTVPLLSAGAWGGQALHLRGNTEGFSNAASSDKWLEMHGGEHWASFSSAAGVALQKRFFGRFLKGDENGWEDEQPRVLLNVPRVDGTFVQRGEAEWPPARTDWTALHLDAAALGAGLPGTDGSVTFDALGEGVEFLAAPFERETELTGPSALTLFASSSTADADIFAILRLYDEEGVEVVFQGSNDPGTALGKGWLRASHRKLDPARSTPHRPFHTHDEVQPLVAGEVVRLDVEIWPLSVIAPAGYRLGVLVQGRDFERETAARLANFRVPLRGSGPYLHDDPTDRPPELFGGRTTIHTGPGTPSSLLLPMIRG
ncbi:MAG TPA: CocE/NonD family hydrolase [Gaiellaceae bacterium]|nr:CocE/NonD family hydrolase [Gaiellaceae bacterium]